VKFFNSIGFITLALTMVSAGAYAQVDWQLRVQQPSFDVEAHALGEQEYKAYLAQTSWRCWAEKPTKNGNLWVRALRCNYSIEASGEFRTFISCGPGKNVDEAAVELKDERKNLDLKLILSCQLNQSDNS
jgi:hypothetical protein